MSYTVTDEIRAMTPEQRRRAHESLSQILSSPEQVVRRADTSPEGVRMPTAVNAARRALVVSIALYCLSTLACLAGVVVGVVRLAHGAGLTTWIATVCLVVNIQWVLLYSIRVDTRQLCAIDERYRLPTR